MLMRLKIHYYLIYKVLYLGVIRFDKERGWLSSICNYWIIG